MWNSGFASDVTIVCEKILDPFYPVIVLRPETQERGWLCEQEYIYVTVHGKRGFIA